MKVQCFPITMTEDEAMAIAKKGGSLLGRLLVAGKQKITLKLMYLESRCNTYEMTYAVPPILKLFPKVKKEEDRQLIRVMVEATTCTASYVPDEIHTEEQEVEDEKLQATYYSDKRLQDCGAIMARRLVKRRTGRDLRISLKEERKVYRPFYIAIYGDMVEGTRARYLPIEADGNRICRAV